VRPGLRARDFEGGVAMKYYKIAAALIGSFVLGAGAVQMLHAQTKPPVYAIAMFNVKDQDGYMKEFLPKAQAGIKENGAEYLAGGMNKTTSFAGEQPPNRVVILKFPSAEAWKKFEDGANGKALREEVSKKYAEWKALWVVEGIEMK
jgi:uncharacterized protein (DUF1330 family)